MREFLNAHYLENYYCQKVNLNKITIIMLRVSGGTGVLYILTCTSKEVTRLERGSVGKASRVKEGDESVWKNWKCRGRGRKT